MFIIVLGQRVSILIESSSGPILIEIDGFSLTGYKFNICHPEVFNTYKNIQRCISQTQHNFIMFIIVLGQRVSILTESSSGPSKKKILT